MKSMTITKWLILLTPVIWLAWDWYAYYHGGNPSTESATLVRWFHYYPQAAFLFGVLVGHIMFDLREPIDWSKDLTKDKK